MQFLMIQNPGVCPVDGIIMLGVSTTRGSQGTIGQFGSGSTHATLHLLREEIPPTIFCGLTRLDFEKEKAKLNDGLVEKEYGKVLVRVSGQLDGKPVKRTIELNVAAQQRLSKLHSKSAFIMRPDIQMRVEVCRNF